MSDIGFLYHSVCCSLDCRPPFCCASRIFATGLKPQSGRGTGAPPGSLLTNYTGLTARSRRLQDLGGRANGRGGSGSKRGRTTRAMLLNVTCGADFTASNPCPEYFDTLLLSLMPTSYSSAVPADTGGFDFISPARSQSQCSSCVGFVAAAAAEAAVAVSTQQQWHNSGATSNRFLWWAAEESFPYTDNTYSIDCSLGRNAPLPGGVLQMVDSGSSLETLARIKESIVLRGGVMTSMVIWSDFRRYPAASPTGVYNTTRRPASDPASAVELQAVYCYGWNDTSVWDEEQERFLNGSLQGFLLCKNSWGTDWGLNGTFRIAYDAAYILQPDYTFAIEFVKDSQGKQAAELLKSFSEKVTDPRYPRCRLFRPPRPMRLLHLVEHLWYALTDSRMTNDNLLGIGKRNIIEELIISNVGYNGLGTAGNISIVATPAVESLLTALVHGNSRDAGGLQPTSFLMCNKTIEIFTGPLSPIDQSQCPPGARADTDLTRCETCPYHHYRSQELPACTPCPAGTGTVLSAFAMDHDDLSDCAPMVEGGPPGVFLESRRTNPAMLSQGLLPGMWQMHPWFEQMCPPGRFITALGVAANGVITGLSAVCDDGTELSPMLAPAGATGTTVTSANGFIGLRTRRKDAGVAAVQYVFSNGSATELLGVPGAAADTTEVNLLCAEHGRERVIGLYGRSTFQGSQRGLGALGVVCGREVSAPVTELGRNQSAGRSSNDVGTSKPFESKCPSGAFVAEIKGWSSNVLDGLQLSCSDGTVLTALGGNQTGSPVTAASSQGFTRITAYVALEGQTIPELEIPPFNVTRVVGLTAVDSSGAITSWGVSSSTVGALNESILSCDGASGNGRIITAFGTMLINLDVEDPAKWPLESLGVACGGIQKFVATCPGLPHTFLPGGGLSGNSSIPQPGNSSITWPSECAGGSLGSVCRGTCGAGTASSTCTTYGWGQPVGECVGNPVVIMSRADPSRCLSYDAFFNPSPVVLQSCSKRAGVAWYPRADGSIRPFTDRCLEVAGALSGPGSTVRVADYWGTQQQHQLWIFDPVKGHLKPRHASWLCLTDVDSSDFGTAPFLWPCAASYGALGNPRQTWVWSSI
eukprot:gene7184-7398_t